MVDAHTSGLTEDRFGRRRAYCGESSRVWNGVHVDAWTWKCRDASADERVILSLQHDDDDELVYPSLLIYEGA